MRAVFICDRISWMRSMRALILAKSASVMVRAAMASTTTTARGTITGSWRPLISSSRFSPELVTGGLGLADRWCWFDMGTEDNVTAVTHTAHDTACMVGGLGNDAVFLDKTVVVFGTGKTCHINTVTDLNSFYSTDGHDRMSKSGIQLVKNRITQTSRNIF